MKGIVNEGNKDKENRERREDVKVVMPAHAVGVLVAEMILENVLEGRHENVGGIVPAGAKENVKTVQSVKQEEKSMFVVVVVVIVMIVTSNSCWSSRNPCRQKKNRNSI